MKVFLLIVLFFLSEAGFSKEQIPRPMADNPHTKLLNYSPNNVHRYVGFYGQQSSIIFDPHEVIRTISMGVSSGWQLDPQDNRLFLKPVTDDADTNATIITNKRIYHFKFHAKEAEGIDDPDIAYEVQISYPSENIIINHSITDSNDAVDGTNSDIPDITSAKNINFNYLVQGNDYIKPLKAFDDGKFTYLEFDSANADLPAIFLVDSEGYESLINFRIRGNYVIIERVAAKFTLRHGDSTVCLTNKNIPFQYKKTGKKTLFSSR